MNKQDLIALAAEAADISKSSAGRVLDSAFGAVLDALARGEEVNLGALGSFHVGSRAPRTGRHPRTGEAIHIDGARVPRFRPGKALKDAVNGTEKG